MAGKQDAEFIDGIACYAPALASANDDYPIDVYELLYKLEERHFWFRARNRIICWALRNYLTGIDHARVLEIGCGTGYVLKGLAAEGRYDLTGAEVHIAGLRYAMRRLPTARFVQLDARQLPYQSEFDAIGAFDVIEHIEEDISVLASIYQALRPEGLLLLTVPQHTWLWSAADDQARHKRRYTRPALLAKIRGAKFDVLRCTSFVTVLLPLLFATRRLRRDSGTHAIGSELELPQMVNAACGAAMRIDEALIRLGFSLPLGGSLLVVAQKARAA